MVQAQTKVKLKVYIKIWERLRYMIVIVNSFEKVTSFEVTKDEEQTMNFFLSFLIERLVRSSVCISE